MTMNRRQILQISAASLAVVGTAGLLAAGNSPVAAVSSARAQSADDLMASGPLPEKMLGEADAPVTIVEYASMTCGHCANFHTGTLPAIKEKYIDTGKVRLVFREFPLDPRATAASMLARCAGDDQFFPMVDVLFKQQTTWARADDARPPLLQIARLAGFTQDSFEACLKNQELLDKIAEIRRRAAEDFGVNSTPTFFINGERYAGNMSVEEMSSLIDDLL